NATEVANVVRDVYREQMNANASPVSYSSSSGSSGYFSSRFGRGRGSSSQNVDANGNPRSVLLSVGVDDRTNSLVVACPERMHDDVKKLIDSLDQAAKDATKTVKVVSIKGIDPALVQEALDAIQGRRTASSGGGFGGSRFGGGSGFSGSSFGSGGSSGMSPFSRFGSGGFGGPSSFWSGFGRGGGGFPGGGGPRRARVAPPPLCR